MDVLANGLRASLRECDTGLLGFYEQLDMCRRITKVDTPTLKLTPDQTAAAPNFAVLQTYATITGLAPICSQAWLYQD